MRHWLFGLAIVVVPTLHAQSLNTSQSGSDDDQRFPVLARTITREGVLPENQNNTSKVLHPRIAPNVSCETDHISYDSVCRDYKISGATCSTQYCASGYPNRRCAEFSATYVDPSDPKSSYSCGYCQTCLIEYDWTWNCLDSFFPCMI
jgi:hypothetical protein